MSPTRWHILGAGAMGCLFAEALAGAGCAVTLILRTPARGVGEVRIDRADGPARAGVGLTGAADAAPIEHLLVATKAPQVASAVASVGHALAAQAPVVLAANGMGFEREVAALGLANPLFACTSTEGAHRVAPLHIVHAGRGQTRIGPLTPGPEPGWTRHWHRALDFSWAAQINNALWHKLAINCAINPLTAVHRCRNGALGRDPRLRREVAALCAEIAATSAAAGLDQTARDIHRDALAVIAATAENRSSMLEDISAGRPTEIDYITGYLLRRAAALGVATPRNQSLYQEVKALER